MNDRWQKDGDRWNSEARIRASRLLRHHVQTKWNPRGRIVRLPCAFYDLKSRTGSYYAPACDRGPTEAHHVDYEQPFLIVWLCMSCHRKVDHGSLRIQKRMLCDYSSLVNVNLKMRRENRVVTPVLELVAPF